MKFAFLALGLFFLSAPGFSMELERAQKIAAESGCELVVGTHVDPWDDSPQSEIAWANRM